MSVCVAVVNGIVVAVCKQILRSGTAVVDKAVRANKSPELRVIIPAIQVIKPRLGVVIIPPVAEGVLIAHGVAGGVGDGAVAPGVVGDGLAVVLGQQISPVAVAVGVSYLRLSCFAINKIFISSFTLVAL